MALNEVISSILFVSERLAISNDVITKRQKPNRLAEVFKMCWDVLFAMVQDTYNIPINIISYSLQIIEI